MNDTIGSFLIAGAKCLRPPMARTGADTAAAAFVDAVVIGQKISLIGGVRVVPEKDKLLPHRPWRWYTG